MSLGWASAVQLQQCMKIGSKYALFKNQDRLSKHSCKQMSLCKGCRLYVICVEIEIRQALSLTNTAAEHCTGLLV